MRGILKSMLLEGMVFLTLLSGHCFRPPYAIPGLDVGKNKRKEVVVIAGPHSERTCTTYCNCFFLFFLCCLFILMHSIALRAQEKVSDYTF